MGSVHKWFISLYVLAIMPVMLVKPAGIFPHGLSHFQVSERICTLCSADNFHVLDHASTGFQLKIKEAIHIQREQP